MKLKLLMLLFVLGLQAQAQSDLVVGPSNRSTTSLEKNVLFNATNFYNVTQSGGASFSLAGLFDGNFSPQYSGAINETDPYVVVIEGLSDVHVQAGAWIGWTTRYFQPTKFKIEIYNINDSGPGYPAPNTWITIADENLYEAYNYITPVTMASVSKIRFTFYKGSGPANAIGLSELFFIHPEAASAYDHLMVQYSANGNVGIGTTTTPQEKLSVNGKIRAKEIKVEATGWPDYVFKPEYQLNTLPELEAYIKANGHLPGVPSAQKAELEGVELGEMNKILLKKIEELTLHLIEKDKKLEETNRKLDKVMQMVETLTQKNK